MKPMVCVRGFDYEPDAKAKRKPVHCKPGDPVPGGLPRDVLRHLCSIDAIRPEDSPADELVAQVSDGPYPHPLPSGEAA